MSSVSKWWIDKLIKSVIERLFDWLFDGVIDCLSQLIDSLNDEKNGWVNQRLVDCWLIDWLIDRFLIDRVVYSRNWYVMTRSRRRVCSTCWWTTPAPQWISTQVGQPSPLGQPGVGCSSTISGTCHLDETIFIILIFSFLIRENKWDFVYRREVGLDYLFLFLSFQPHPVSSAFLNSFNVVFIESNRVNSKTKRSLLILFFRNMSQCVKSLQAHNGRVSSLSFMPLLDKSNVNLVMSAHKSISKSKLRLV